MKAELPDVQWRRSFPCGLLLAASLAGWSIGCGGRATPPTGTIQGQVTYDGKPVTSGDVTFYSSELGSGVSEPLDADGHYATQTPIPTGKYVVTVLPPSTPPPEDPAKLVVRIVYKDIPTKYQDPSKSGLAIDVQAGPNSFDIQMNP